MPERTLVLPAPTTRRRKTTTWTRTVDVAARVGSGVVLVSLLAVSGAVVASLDSGQAPVDTAQVVTYRIAGH